jgi:hypothetical protein
VAGYIKGGIGMTKTIVVPEIPLLDYTLNIPINSIVAAAKTAHDLESARRKAARDKASGLRGEHQGARVACKDYRPTLAK